MEYEGIVEYLLGVLGSTGRKFDTYCPESVYPEFMVGPARRHVGITYIRDVRDNFCVIKIHRDSAIVLIADPGSFWAPLDMTSDESIKTCVLDSLNHNK